MAPNFLTPSTILPSFPMPGDRIKVIKGRKHPIGARGTVLQTGTKHFGGTVINGRRVGGTVSRWALIRWDVQVQDSNISMDNIVKE